MAEHIELRSFSNNLPDEETENVIEEYHETNQRNDILLSKSIQPIRSYEFFTSYDVKSALSESLKKKNKKKEKSTIMDIISSELTSLAVPVEKNVTTFVKSDYRFVEQPSYLKSSLRGFDRRRRFQSGTAKLMPQFPNISFTSINDDSLQIGYIKPVKFENIISHSNSITEESSRFLDIEITDMKIRHHHKFTLEHLLAVALQEYYDEYNKIESLLQELDRDIEVNRKTKESLKEDLLKINPKQDVRFDVTVRKYTGILLKLKDQYYELIKIRKDIVHKVVSLWSDIQNIREKSESILTPYVVEVINREFADAELQKEWNNIFTVEYTDMLSKIEHEYVCKYMEYKEAERGKYNDDFENKGTKPKLKFDNDYMKIKVEEIVNEILIRYGTNLCVRCDQHTTTKRPLMLTYSFKIYVDDLFVCETEQNTISVISIFKTDIFESLSVEILPHNTSLIIVLSENDKNVASYKINLSEICDSSNVTKPCLVKFKFNDIIKPNNKYVGSGFPIKEIVANKIRLKSSSLFKTKLYTHYDVNLKLGWNEKLNKTKVETIKSYVSIDKQIKRIMSRNIKPDFDLIADLINKVYNKNTNEDENMSNILQNLCKLNYLASNDKLKKTEINPELSRFKLLALRDKSGRNNIKNKAIPIFASQISTDQLKCLQKSKQNEFELQLLNGKYSEMDPIEIQRLVGIIYIQKLNKNVHNNLNEFLLRKTNKDVVRDFRDLSLRGLFFNQGFTSLTTLSSITKQQILNDAMNKEQEIYVTVIRAFNLLDRNSSILLEDEDDEKIAGVKIRPVRPFVKLSYRDVKEQTTVGIGCHPTWNQTLKMKIIPEPLSSIHINIYDEHKIIINESYPEEEHSFQSRTVHYRYYNKWLGTVKVPMYNVFALGTVRETFKISTPPMIIGYENAQCKDSAHSLIPEVIQLLKKESPLICLQISTSLSHLGKVQGYRQPVPNNSDEDYVIKHLNNFVTDYTNDFPSRNICLAFIDSSGRNKCVTQFLQPIPPPESKFFPKTKCRSESAKSKSSGKSSSSKDSRKNVDIEKGDPSNEEEEKESVYSIYEGHWRTDDVNITRIINSCARYVSLIPTYEVTESHVATLRGLELLKILNGSLLDHTILLSSYFLYLGVKFWVAIGLGVPYGVSSYVLTKYDQIAHKVVMTTDQSFRNRSFLSRPDSQLWHVYDAVNGGKFELRDVNCPLKTIDYVFNNENIWVNMQSSQNCENVSFNFTKGSEWQPVFDKSIFVMRLPMVNDCSLYTLPADVESLRQIIEDKIRSKIQKWRSNVKTVWNRYCSSLLREVLPYWESWSFNPSEPRPGLGQKLKQLMVTYQVYGLPLNVPYVSTKSVISTIKSTGVHENDDPSVEFGLAVELYGYPNNVLSVWVFLASICKIQV